MDTLAFTVNLDKIGALIPVIAMKLSICPLATSKWLYHSLFSFFSKRLSNVQNTTRIVLLKIAEETKEVIPRSPSEYNIYSFLTISVDPRLFLSEVLKTVKI